MAIELHISDKNTMFWYRNNNNHNNYGPAVKFSDGRNIWYVNSKHHRTDGPAVGWLDGYKEWWVNGVKYSYLEYLIAVDEYKLNNELNGN